MLEIASNVFASTARALSSQLIPTALKAPFTQSNISQQWVSHGFCEERANRRSFTVGETSNAWHMVVLGFHQNFTNADILVAIESLRTN